jgi:DNA-binding response OmpR family regulator
MPSNVLRRTILVCDDNEDILEILDFELSQHGFDVLLAHGYEELMALIQSHEVDLILLDISMPERDGFLVAETLQARGFKAPIIFITAFDKDFYRRYASLIGAVDFVAKPIDMDVLVARINKALLKSSTSTRFMPATTGHSGGFKWLKP